MYPLLGHPHPPYLPSGIQVTGGSYPTPIPSDPPLSLPSPCPSPHHFTPLQVHPPTWTLPISRWSSVTHPFYSLTAADPPPSRYLCRLPMLPPLMCSIVSHQSLAASITTFDSDPLPRSLFPLYKPPVMGVWAPIDGNYPFSITTKLWQFTLTLFWRQSPYCSPAYYLLMIVYIY